MDVCVCVCVCVSVCVSRCSGTSIALNPIACGQEENRA